MVTGTWRAWVPSYCVTDLFKGDKDPLDRFQEGVARVLRPGESTLSVDWREVAPHRRRGRC